MPLQQFDIGIGSGSQPQPSTKTNVDGANVVVSAIDQAPLPKQPPVDPNMTSNALLKKAVEDQMSRAGSYPIPKEIDYATHQRVISDIGKLLGSKTHTYLGLGLTPEQNRASATQAYKLAGQLRDMDQQKFQNQLARRTAARQGYADDIELSKLMRPSTTETEGLDQYGNKGTWRQTSDAYGNTIGQPNFTMTVPKKYKESYGQTKMEWYYNDNGNRVMLGLDHPNISQDTLGTIRDNMSAALDMYYDKNDAGSWVDSGDGKTQIFEIPEGSPLHNKSLMKNVHDNLWRLYTMSAQTDNFQPNVLGLVHQSIRSEYEEIKRKAFAIGIDEVTFHRMITSGESGIIDLSLKMEGIVPNPQMGGLMYVDPSAKPEDSDTNPYFDGDGQPITEGELATVEDWYATYDTEGKTRRLTPESKATKPKDWPRSSGTDQQRSRREGGKYKRNQKSKRAGDMIRIGSQ